MITKNQIVMVHRIIGEVITHLPAQISILAQSHDMAAISATYSGDAAVFYREMDSDKLKKYMFGKFGPNFPQNRS